MARDWQELAQQLGPQMAQYRGGGELPRLPGLAAPREQALAERAQLGLHPSAVADLAPAGTGTCGTCTHCVNVLRPSRRSGNVVEHWRCELGRAMWTHGATADIRRSWPACTKFDAKPGLRKRKGKGGA